MRIVTCIVIGSVFSLVNATIAGAQPKLAAIHGASAAKYDEWTNGLDKQKLRPAFVSVAEIKGEPTYAAIAIENKPREDWSICRDLTSQAYQQEFLAQNAKGLRPICVVGYRKGDAINYAAIFLKDNAKAWYAKHGLDPKQNQEAFDSLTKAGYRPVRGVAYQVGDGVQFSYLYAKDDVKNWLSQSGLTADQYEKLIGDYSKKNVHPVSACAYATKNGTRFAAIVVEDTQQRTWSTKHHLTPKQFQDYFNDMTGKGYRPTQICAYPWEDGVRYLAVFVKENK
jgi:Bacterial tandem repeat domain 1